jgi:hypothetical protein
MLSIRGDRFGLFTQEKQHIGLLALGQSLELQSIVGVALALASFEECCLVYFSANESSI